jgi:hypothetical protein
MCNDDSSDGLASYALNRLAANDKHAKTRTGSHCC